MKTKSIALIAIFSFTLSTVSQTAFAEGLKEAGASLLLPTTGQTMNDEFGTTKTKLMAGIEVASIATVAILGTAVGGGIVWLGLAPMLANHTWSSVDAYKGAKRRQDPLIQQQMYDAQRTIDISRQKRFEREQAYRSDAREKIRRAGEQSNY